MRTKFLTAIAVLLSIYSGSSSSQDNPHAHARLLEDAREIITSERNDVRLWAGAPRLLVVGDAEVELHVRRIVDVIEQAIVSPFGDTFFGSVQFEQFPPFFGDGQGRLWVRIREGGPSGQQISLNLGQGDALLEAEIVVVVGDRVEVALMNGLWGLSPRSNRAMLQGGTARCFYSVRSHEGTRHGAFVSIFDAQNPAFLEECLWEEILHALGPLQDVEGTPYFSFDDQASNVPGSMPQDQRELDTTRRANDLLLIRALYESGVRPGDPPDGVIEYLDGLIGDN